jgi:hypothetical protein
MTGGNGRSSSITGTPVTRAGGGGAGGYGTFGSGGLGGGGIGRADVFTRGGNGEVNTGSGGGSGGGEGAPNFRTGGGGTGGSGIVILRYPDFYNITIGSGLTGTTSAPVNGYKVTTFTAGTGNISF